MQDGRSTSGSELRASGDANLATAGHATLNPNAARFRLAAWTLYPVLAVIYVVCLLWVPGGLTRFLVLEAIYLLPIVGAVVLGAVAARRSEGVEWRFWVLLSIANFTLGVCELLLIYWVMWVSPTGPAPVTWPFQVLHVVAAACFVGLVFSMARLQDDGFGTRARALIDAVAVGILAYVLILQVYARPVMNPTHPPVIAVLVGAAYPLAGFLMLFGTLGNLVGFKMVKWRSWEMLTAVAMGIYATAIWLWPLWYTSIAGTTRNTERGLLDLIQFSGHFLFMIAAVYRLTEADEWRLRPMPLPSFMRSRWAGVFLPIATVSAILVLGWLASSEFGSPEWFAVYGVLALALTVLVLSRSLLLALEHGTLFVRSVTDPLTGLYNHRYFKDRLAIELEQAKRYDEPLSVAMIDIDDFGAFNDRDGHLAGDRLLAGIGARLIQLTDGSTVVARLGGDEFGIILPETDARNAAVFVQHVVDVIGVECGSHPSTVSASAGVAAYPEDGSEPADLVTRADGALFHAKETGKSRVVVFDPARVPDMSARERIDRLEKQSRISAVQALAAAVDARHPETRYHSQRVATLAVRMGEHLGLPEAEIRTLELVAVVHDVGKIAVGDAILNKPEALDAAEWDEIRLHPEQGQRILASTGLPELVPGVRSHHERWDGSGYPDGLVGEEIPFEARLIGLCDAYEAMTATRSYRNALSHAEACAEISRQAGTQFDPRLATRILATLETFGAAIGAIGEQQPADHGSAAAAWVALGELGPERV